MGPGLFVRYIKIFIAIVFKIGLVLYQIPPSFKQKQWKPNKQEWKEVGQSFDRKGAVGCSELGIGKYILVKHPKCVKESYRSHC